jgi:predicted nucleic acid-binding protein
MPAVIVDSGFLVALGIRRDPRHAAAKAFLKRYAGEIIVPSPVVVESCYFFSTSAKVSLLDWLEKRQAKVLELPIHAYAEIGSILSRYASLDPDFTDAAIVWLADKVACRAILTVDARDFGVFRLKGGKRFEVISWYS